MILKNTIQHSDYAIPLETFQSSNALCSSGDGMDKQVLSNGSGNGATKAPSATTTLRDTRFEITHIEKRAAGEYIEFSQCPAPNPLGAYNNNFINLIYTSRWCGYPDFWSHTWNQSRHKRALGHKRLSKDSSVQGFRSPGNTFHDSAWPPLFKSRKLESGRILF